MSKTYNNSITNKLINKICDGRLTLESGVAVSTTDQTAKTVVYFTPYNGNTIGLYDGSEWDLFSFSELSLSLSGYTANTNYDVFVYNNSGALTLESAAWTNDTTRATNIVLQDGIYVKSGSTTRRYLGTIRTTGTIGQCEDSNSTRFIWNYYNGVQKRLRSEHVTLHTYNGATWRPYANNTTLGSTRVQYVFGILGARYSVDWSGWMDSGIIARFISVGIDSTTTPSFVNIGNHNAANCWVYQKEELYSIIGYHYLQLLQYSNGTSNFASGFLRMYALF